MSHPSTRDDHAWLLEHTEEAIADALWPHLEVAETERLYRVYGYPKDNAMPPPLRDRLRDPAFLADALMSLHDDMLTQPSADARRLEHLQQQLKRLAQLAEAPPPD